MDIVNCIDFLSASNCVGLNILEHDNSVRARKYSVEIIPV